MKVHVLAVIAVALLVMVLIEGRPRSRKGRDVTERVFRALEKAVSFFESDYKDLNLDGLYGLRVAQGQLIDVVHGVTSGEINLPADTKERILKLITSMERISKTVINNLRDSAYYDKFKFIVSRPYQADYNPTRAVNDVDTNTSPLEIVDADEIHNYDEKFGDQCFQDLIGSYHIPGRPGQCFIPPKCADYLLKGKGVFGYRLTHQLLFIIVGKSFHCEGAIEQQLGYPLEQASTAMCSKVFMEAMLLLTMGAAESKSRDFFMEEVSTCSMLGFQDFFRKDWIRKILAWQHKSGCFTDGSELAGLKRGTSMRKLLVERKIKGECLSHESGLGTSVLGTYLRYLLENNGKFRN